VGGEQRYLQTICYQPNAAWEKLFRVGYDFQAGMCLLVMAKDKKIIGIGRLFADRQNSPNRPTGNVGLVVARAWRGRGMGTKLLTNLIISAQRMGYIYLRAEVLRCNRISLKLFQNFGFVATHIHKMYWPARQAWVDEVTVERCIIKPAGLFNKNQ
jgi:RimJ/RimL family protein N-acetyltransferase